MDEHERSLAKRGIEFGALPDGRKAALGGPEMLCPVCRAGDGMPDCSECAGRGEVTSVPWAERPWDEVIDNLWVGGHDCQPEGAPPSGNCYLVNTDFDLVVSLYLRTNDRRYSPPRGVEHHYHRMADAELDSEHHTRLDDLASTVREAVEAGKKVLVRCQAGLNRSSLVVALAMIQMGWEPDAAIERIRQVRSPFVLCNEHFVEYLRAKA